MKPNLTACKLLLILAGIAVSAVVKAQSTAYNYILTYVPRVPVSNAATLPGSAVGNVNQTVQYFDGLGRPIQTVQTQASPTQRDMVQPMAYDQFDREAIKYLPYVVATTAPNDGSYKTTAITDQASFYANPTNSTWNAPGVASTPYPVSVTAFESSPLNRTLEQGFAGDNWQLTGTVGPASPGHTVKMLYASNDAGSLTSGDGYWAQLYTVTYSYPEGNYDYRNSLANSGPYPANTLYVTVTKNENWSASQTDTTLNTTQEYKDLFGRVVLKRTFNYTTSRQVLSTYYVYDEYGYLTYVLPPQANPDAGNITQAVLDNLCYQYRYDGRGRVIYKKIPGKGWEFMIYNNLNQVIATQDSAQRMKVPQQLLYTKYDAQGRVVTNGYYKTSDNTPGVDDRVTLQAAASAQTTLWETKLATGSYTSATIPTTGGTALVTNYYDDYKIAALPATYTLTAGVSAMTRGLLTCSKVAIVATPSDILWKVNYYDDLGRATNSYAQHYLGGHAGLSTNNYDLITTTYNFTNAPTTITRQHNNTTANPLVTITNTYYYDQVGRKLSSWEQITNGGGSAGPKTLVSKIDYNQIGQVTNKHLHSTDSVNYLQTIAYTYNERGWLTYSSAPLFAMQLQYNTGATKAWNGNIMYQYWGTPGNLANHYSYVYDYLDRLTGGVNPVSNNKENAIAYDLNGNITALNRYQNNAQIDQLSYIYTNAGGNYTNQLQTVTDNSGSNAGLVNGATAYTYDGNGNMLSAANTANNAQNKSFTYNMFNMPVVATMPAGTATYTYDGNSEKLEKVAVISGATTITDYIGGIQYNGNGTTDTLSFIPTEEGRALHNGTTYDYQYYLGDNLGNTRITFNSKTGTAVTIQQDDYYPFGWEISQPSPTLNPKNEYLYNKKELQEEFGEYDYGARFYDPLAVHWTSVDPMAENSRRWSPYNYVDDNPIRNIDPNGMEIVGVEFVGELAQDVFAAFQQQRYAQPPRKKKKQSGLVPLNITAKRDAIERPGKKPSRYEVAMNTAMLLTAAEANVGFQVGPYRAGVPVKEYQSPGESGYVRFSTAGKTKVEGQWIMKEEDAVGLTPEEIQATWNLPFTPDRVAKVEIPEGMTVRAGVSADAFGHTGEGIQYQLMSRGATFEDVQAIGLNQVISTFGTVTTISNVRLNANGQVESPSAPTEPEEPVGPIDEVIPKR